MKEYLEHQTSEIPADVSQMKDIIDIEGVFVNSEVKLAIIAMFVLIIAGIVLFLFWAIKKIKAKRASRELMQKPDQRFKADLDRLLMQGLIEKGEQKKFYFFLSEMTRRFIEEHFGYAALDKTTSEIEQEFLNKNTTADELLRQKLRELFKKTDAVKFAGFKPSPEEVLKDIDLVKNWVQTVCTNKL